MCLEVIRCLQALPDDSVVVNFAIDCKSNVLILVGKGLRATLHTNDTQTLVSKNWPVVSHTNPKVLPLNTYWCCWQGSFQTNLGLYAYIA